ncbi:phosphoenolpyruvate synthase [Pseudactinotalea sp. HY160]|uniref:PEP/pyruvate-binding domain-containing protein n=1 Tax=Pseudactinotalea sp. HY160 TaxID=2654490 RepID=UPI00128BB599|nr:PEP/pyruvate-binding domain-containing protein [Pseudactinotalea sp. HY160]MPV50664.1 phosphoenolpyruvate synthase [Pseudactinotalea sp. HY160]
MNAPAESPVACLDAVRAADLPLVGGKAANLGELLHAGLPVPPGFVVTTAAYARAATRAGLDDLLADPAIAPATLRVAIETAQVPADLREAVTGAYRALGPDAAVAVRSSATAEDLPGAAFAGQQDTYLNVVGAGAVVDAVRRCWASLWTDRAIAYRRDRSIDPADVRIAVVVQVMVEADLAGVMFTADPVSGARDRLLVDAGAGLGEAVVSGLVTPDHYVLDPRGRLLEWTPGRGEVIVRASAGGGVVRDEHADGAPGSPLLTRAALAGLAAHARTIAGHFGRPQDIEWAIAGSDAWILQARPMTALPPPSVPLNRRQRLQGAILTEYLPQRPYPMDVTTLVARGPAAMMAEIGREYGIAGLFADVLREEEGVAVAIVPPSVHPTPRTLASIGAVARRIRRYRPADWARDPRHVDYLAEVAALEALDLAALPWAGLIGAGERALTAQDYCRDLRIDYLPGAAAAFVRVTLAVTLLGRRALLAELLGGVRTRTEDSNRALARLADDVRADPRLRSLLEGAPGVNVPAALERDGRFEDFRAGLEAFLREYGRRETASPLLISPPTLAESPEIVLGMITSLAGRPPAAGEAVSRSAEALRRLLDHPLLRRSPRRRERMRRRVQAARDGVAFREDTHFYFTAALPTLRRVVLELGRRLHASGLLDDPADVFQLRWEEVGAIAEPDAIDPARSDELREEVRRRAAKRAELAGVPMIDPRRVFPAAATGDALVTGTPAGSGTATGTARIIRGADDFDRLGEGEILVCPYTNPAWTPLFQRAAAVVVDTGSTASHAAIVAREYGLPAVMGTGSGTAVIADGQLVTVDGTRGRVIGSDPR